MPTLINILIIILIVTLFIWSIIEVIISHAIFRALIQIVISIGILIILLLFADFPAHRVAFGGFSPITAIIIMFPCVCLGIAANHWYSSKEKFNWAAFFKTLIIAPIILLPLIGSIQGSSDLATFQLICFGILAFQNGFFWKEALENARMQK